MAETTGARRIRVLLVDDHGVVRRGLRGYPELLVSNIPGKLDLQSRTQTALYVVERKLVRD